MVDTPDDLVAIPRWVVWREQTRKGKKTKPPRTVRNELASATDPKDWSEHAAVTAVMAKNPDLFDGAGIILGQFCPTEFLAGIDLDTCLHNGSLAPWAAPFITLFPTYTEISPSGMGLKLFFTVTLADVPALKAALGLGEKQWGRKRTFGDATNGHDHPPAAELYLSDRFFTVTGNRWPNSPLDVALATGEQLAALATLLRGNKEPRPTEGDEETYDGTIPDDADLEQKLKDACAADTRLAARWGGSTTGLNDTSRSARDMSLGSMLKAAGFTLAEMRALLVANEHGAGDEHADDNRYFERIWNRTGSKPPPQEPEGFELAPLPDGEPPAQPKKPAAPPQPAATNQAEPEWTADLAVDNKGRVLSTAANAILILAKDPAFNGVFGRNAFNAQSLLKVAVAAPFPDLPPQPAAYPRAWVSADILLVQAYLQRSYSQRFSFEMAERAMDATAAARSFHPVTEWIETLQWDGRPRVDTWLINAFNADDTDYTRAVGAKFLIAAVRRVRDPGCQFDYMLVLEGPTGIGKSKSCRRLFGDEWFTDDMPHNLQNKDSPLALLGVWGVEFAEIEQITGTRVATETVKAFLSRRVDRFRPPYGRGIVTQPRQCVFIGTTNRDEWLMDETGNRRFWPVYCRTADPTWVSVNRDQLWAEAAAREAAGEAAWLDNDELQQEAARQQEKRVEHDPWTPEVRSYIKGKPEVVSDDVLRAVVLNVERRDRAAQMRVARILRLEGWYRVVTKEKKTERSLRVWRPSSTIL